MTPHVLETLFMEKFTTPWCLFQIPEFDMTRERFYKWVEGEEAIPRHVAKRMIELSSIYDSERARLINEALDDPSFTKILVDYASDALFKLREPETYEKFFKSRDLHMEFLLFYVRPKLEELGFTCRIVEFMEWDDLQELKSDVNRTLEDSSHLSEEEIVDEVNRLRDYIFLEKIYLKENLIDKPLPDLSEREIEKENFWESLYQDYVEEVDREFLEVQNELQGQRDWRQLHRIPEAANTVLFTKEDRIARIKSKLSAIIDTSAFQEEESPTPPVG